MSDDRQDAQPGHGGLGTETAPRAAPAAAEHEPWLEEDLAPLPPRPRRKLLAPVPLGLLAVLLLACGFIGGVLVEKGQNGSSGTTAGRTSAFASRLRGLSASRSAAGAGASPFAGAPGGAGATVGTVAFLSGSTLYVTSGEGNTVKVETSAATSVTKSVDTAVRKIHPGESVTITGTAASDGTVTAAAIRVGTSSAGGLGALLGGASGSGKGTGGTSSSSRSSESPALFGAG
jgi:hypothetical protein